MPLIVTLEEAKVHLHIDADFTDSDTDITEKIHQASAAVIAYLKGVPDWLDSSGEVVEDSPGVFIPWQIRAATFQLLTALFENRGDDGGEASKFSQGYLPPAVTALLYPLRDPALA
jgi:hypothetical protein